MDTEGERETLHKLALYQRIRETNCSFLKLVCRDTEKNRI
jgi:hypothetical protein